MLKNWLGVVRSIDVVNEMSFSKPSVSIAMKRFRKNGLIEMDSDGYITLLPPGLAIAVRTYTRHRILTRLLVQLDVSEQTAAEDACKIEHDLSDEAFEKIREFVSQE